MQLALTEPQEDFVFCPDPFPAMVGGLGSGKTMAGSTRILIRMLQEPGINCAHYLPTYDLLRLRAIPGMEALLEQLRIPYKTNKQEFSIEVLGYGSIIFRSYDNPARIVSYEVAHSIVDELDTLPKEKAELVWRKVSERNRQRCKGANTIGNVTTPDQGYSGFTYAKWGKNPAPGYRVIKAATASNPYLPEGYVEQIRSNYDPLLADMYLSGEFVSLSRNKVYHFFDRKKHHNPRELKDSDSYLHIGLDFNIGGTCATVWIIENNKPIAVDEFTSHDTADFINRCQPYRKQGRTITVYPDASGRSGSTNASLSDIALLSQSHTGLRVDAANSNPPVRDRVNCVNALLAHDRMSVNTDKCPNLTHALEAQGYDKKGDPEKFDAHPAIDDWVDGAGYFLHRKFPITRPLAQVRIGGI